MKKLLFGLFATIMFGVTGNAQDLSKLTQDANFKLYLKNQLEFSKKCTDNNRIKELLSDGKLDEMKSIFFTEFFQQQKKVFQVI